MLLAQLANGVLLGSTYALIAIGYTLVFGVLLVRAGSRSFERAPAADGVSAPRRAS